MDAATAPASEFDEWAQTWVTLAKFPGRAIPNEDERIAQIVELWHQPIPGDWQRDLDLRLEKPLRYLRGNAGDDAKRRGEHAIEHSILIPQPGESEATCLGAPLVDGVNALPLAKDVRGGRSGNVEADMLLLAGADGGYRVLLVEVKAGSNNAWYGAVENLRQLKLFLTREQNRKADGTTALFQARRSELALANSLPVIGVTLAPPAFYSARGKKRESVAPAQRLLRQMRVATGIDVCLAVWAPSSREINLLPTTADEK